MTNLITRAMILIFMIVGLSQSLYANVFGTDNRTKPGKDIYQQAPFSQIVKVGKCTGALVGPNLVLSAYHCVDHITKEDGSISKGFKVRVNRFGFSSKETSRVKAMVHGGGSGDENDWAILILEKNLGSRFGYFPVQDHVNDHYQVNLFGFSADLGNNNPSFHKDCQVRGIEGDLLLHDCDSSGGASGAPLWRKKNDGYVIVGLHIGGRRLPGEANIRRLRAQKYEHEIANIAVLPHIFFNEIYERLP